VYSTSDADGFLEALPGGRAVALQELPFADVELRLAALFRLAADRRSPKSV
jgi:hypothetical protein